MQPPLQPQATMWQPPAGPVAGSTNDRRLSHGRTTMMGSATSSAFVANPAGPRTGTQRRPHRPYPSTPFVSVPRMPATASTGSNQQSTSNPNTQSFLLVMLPYGPEGATVFDDLDPFQRTRPSFKIYPLKYGALIQKLIAHNLAFDITVTASFNQNIWSEINTLLTNHARQHNFRIHGYNLSSSSASFFKSPFALLEGGYRNTAGQKLNLSKLAEHQMTLSSLMKVAQKVQNPVGTAYLLFYACKGRLDGPLHPGGSEIHACFASHVINEHITDAINEPALPVSCHENCPSLSQSPFSSPSPSSDAFDFLAQVTDDDDDPSDIIPTNRRPVSSGPSTPPPSVTPRSTVGPSSATLFPLLPPRPVTPTPMQPRRSNRRMVPITPTEWVDFIKQNSSSQENAIALDLVAPDVEKAAKAFIERLLAYHLRTTPPQLPEEVEVRKFSFADLIGGKRRWKVGAGIGEGTERAVLRAAILAINTQTTFWRVMADDMYSWAIRTTNTIPANRLAMARTYGTLCALHMAWLAVLPHPVAPWLLYAAVHDFPTLLDLAFIRSLCPSLGDDLRHWPSDPSTPLVLTAPTTTPTGMIIQVPSPCAQVIMTYLAIQPSELSDLDRGERDSYSLELYSHALFGCNYDILKNSKELEEFKMGFNLQVSPSLLFKDTFGESNHTKILFKKMTGRRIQSPNDFIPFIRVIDHPTEPDLHNHFQLWIARYLRGKGHPPSTQLDPLGRPVDLVSPEMREADTNNVSYRCERLLKLGTGSELLPTEDGWNMTFRFVVDLPMNHRYQPRNRPEGWTASSTPLLFFRACLSEVDIIDTPHLRAMLLSPMPPEDDGPSEFDQAVHRIIVSFGTSDEFTAI